MQEENAEKMNFFKRVISSIKDFDKYQDFAVERTSKALAYLLIIMTIFSFAIAGAFTYKFGKSFNEGVSYFKENINELNFDGETLSINNGEEKTIINEEEVLQAIIINTNVDISEAQKKDYLDTIAKYENGIVLLNDKVIYKNQLFSENMEYKYKDNGMSYGITTLNKEDVINFIGEINGVRLYIGFFIVIAIYLFVIYFASAIVDIAMLAVLGFIVSRIVGMKIKIKACFNMGVYALTLPTILNLIYILVNVFTSFEVKYFQWMYTTISYIYMIVAILIIKSDFINKQMELMKIIEEQEKVKKEIEEQERRKKEEEKEKTKDDNDKEEKKEKRKKNKDKEEKGVDDKGLAPQE